MTRPIIFGVGEEFLERDGLGKEVAEWEDGLRAETDPGTFEWWYFDAHLEDGSTAVIVYATKPIISPNLALTPNLSLTITRPDGSKMARFDLPAAGEFAASKKGCEVRIGASRVKQTREDGQWVYHLHAEAGELAADLTFRGLVPPWRPGAGKGYYGDLGHYFAWLPAIPHGSVEGTLTYDGQTHTVEGTGYHDHNWGNVALPAVMDHWTWGRAHVDGYTMIFVEQIAAKRYGSVRMPVFLLAKGDQVLVEDARYLSMEARDFVRHPGGREIPGQVDFTWQRGGEVVRLRLRDQKMIEGTSLLLALPKKKRWLAKLFANPYYFRFNTTLELEIGLDHLKDSVKGTALYEIMMLR